MSSRRIDYINWLLILALLICVGLFVGKSYITVTTNSNNGVEITLGKYVINKFCYNTEEHLTICEDLPGHKIYTLEVKREQLDRQVLFLRSE